MSMLHGTRRALLGGGLKPFNFNPRLCTFTPSMSKRAGTVFAGAPIIQGNWDGSGTPDVLSFARGTQVSGHWYDNFDAYQGGGFGTWYPEQSSADRTDGNNSEFWLALGGYRFYYEWDNNRYRLEIGSTVMSVSATVTAGTPEYLAWGFDTNQKLDGTNYVYLSRNDVQTYGVTSQPTAGAPNATIYIGSNGTGRTANGVIEGLTFVREIPWTGTYGTDMGQGDIVAAHAAGADVALSIASWGTTWSMPTDATPGALVTGAGEAWSHPHRTNLLGVGAFMMDGTYTNDGWADEGTPTAVAALAAAEKIGPGGYKVTSDAANEGIYKDITLSAGDDVVIRASGYSDGTSVPKCILYDQIGGAEIGSIGSDVLDRVTDGDFAAAGNWTLGDGWSIAAGVASCDGSQVAHSSLFQLLADQGNGGLVVGTTYNTSFTISNYVAGQVRIILGSTSGTFRGANGTYTEKLTFTGATDIYIKADTDFDGDIDDVIVTRTSTRAHPDVFLFTGEAPAGCTTIRVKLVNTDATAAHITYWNEAPVYDNLITNPSLEGVYVGAENIPIGWTNAGLDVGDVQESSGGGAIIHSGSEAMQWNVGASLESIYQNMLGMGLSEGDFFSYGGFFYGDGAVGVRLQMGSSSHATFQYSTTEHAQGWGTTAAWDHMSAVYRKGATSGSVYMRCGSGATGNRYTDDIYAIALDAVSITATPANLANSTEGTGLRVDGRDSCSQVATHLTATRGRVRWKMTPRHSDGLFETFHSSAVFIQLLGDANNYIQLYSTSDIALRLRVVAAGVTTNQTWDGAEIIKATEVSAELRYNSARAVLLIDGVEQCVNTPAAGIRFAVPLTTCYWGNNSTDSYAVDATYAAP